MRLLLYNPNTNRDLTAALAKTVRQLLRPDDILRIATSESGEAFIGSEDSIAVARTALQTELRRRAGDCDAVLLGCFGDLGVDDVRQELRRPIVSLSDSIFASAPVIGRRIGFVTTSSFWAHRLVIEARRKNAGDFIADVRSIEISARDNSVSLAARCRSAIAGIAQSGRSEIVVLSGAMLIALSPELVPGSPLPFFDPLAASLGLCRTAHESLVSIQR